MAVNDRPIGNTILYKEDGSAVLVGSRGEIYTSDLSIAVGRGLVTGTSGLVKGYATINSTTIIPVRATTYTEPTSAAARELVSSSTQDDATPGGTGTRRVRITYYDGSMNGPYTEDIDLNGTAAVTTVATNIRFIEKMESLIVGSNGTNVGTITIRNTGAGATIGTIAVSDGCTYWAHHYVADGYTSFVQSLTAGVIDNGLLGSISCSMFLRVATPLTANSFEKQLTFSFRQQGSQPSQTHNFANNLWVRGPARISLYVRDDNTTAGTAHGGFTFYDV